MFISSRSAMMIIFLLSLVVLVVSILAVTVYFALPRPNWVEVGSVADFPPYDEPYEVREPVHVYIVNDGERIMAIDPLYRGRGGYVVRWWTEDQVFIDPSTGAWVDLYGRPVRWVDRSLAQYPVRVEADKIRIDWSRPQVKEYSSGG